MALGQTQYFYTVELIALEEQIRRSLDRVNRMREKAVRRQDFRAADQISRLERVIDLVQRRMVRLM
jgi:hypothetical protein